MAGIKVIGLAMFVELFLIFFLKLIFLQIMKLINRLIRMKSLFYNFLIFLKI